MDYFETLPKELSGHHMTTIILFDFISGVDYLNSGTVAGRAWGSIMSQMSRESTWKYTMLTEPFVASDQRIAFIGVYLVALLRARAHIKLMLCA